MSTEPLLSNGKIRHKKLSGVLPSGNAVGEELFRVNVILLFARTLCNVPQTSPTAQCIVWTFFVLLSPFSPPPSSDVNLRVPRISAALSHAAC